ncbi:MAG: tape measure protein, partial [Victivallaceae bacterium]|nr:tape measure protein [Victivallaceae bacterium]
MQEFRTRFTTDMTQHRRAMGQFRQQTSTAVADARNQLMMLAGITLGGLSVGKMVKDTIALGAEMEKTRVAFDVMLGSVEASKSTIADLMQFADVTPFEPDEVIKAGRGLLAANVQASALTGKLEFLGNIASGTGSGLGEMVNIYMKAANKGKVQAEELNQLAERGVPIYAALANSIGVSTAEIGKMGERGELSFTLLENALISLGGEGGKYGGLMAKQSQTLDGLLSTLSGKIKLVGTAIGELAIPQLSKNIADLIAK